MAKITHIDRKATEDKIIREIGHGNASFTELQEKTGLNKVTLNDYLKRMTRKEIVKTLVEGKIRYRLSKQGKSLFEDEYLKFVIESLIERKYVYWHDNLSAEDDHKPIVNWIKGMDGFSFPDWIMTDGITLHTMYSNRFSDAYLPIYPVIPGLCKDALTGYQKKLIDFAMKQDHDLPIENLENKIVVAFEFDLDRIAQTLNDIRKQKEVKS